MQLRNKRCLIIDTETSGLPMCRPKMPKHMKYPNPRFAIAYEGARLLSLAYSNTTIGNGPVDFNRDNAHFIRNNSDLKKSLYQTNKDKFADNTGAPIREILDAVQVQINLCDYIVGHNVLFDINIIAHEAFLLEHPLYQTLMSKMASVEYFCTMDAAARMGIDARNLQLSEVYNFMNDGAEFSNQKLEFHDAMDDVKATKLILERIIGNSFTIPASILTIMDEVYPVKSVLPKTDLTSDFASEEAKSVLQIYLTEFGFEYYCDIIKYDYCTYNAAGLAIFHGVDEAEIAKIKLFSKDGVYKISIIPNNSIVGDNNRIVPCYYSDQDIIFTCESCVRDSSTRRTFGFEICDECADSTSAFEAYYAMMKLETNPFNTYTTAEVKALIPKDKPRRSGTIALEVKKRGRNNTVSADIVDFYIANKLYNYFSLTIGATKL